MILGTEQSYIITTCTIHAHFVNLGRPGTYASEINRMLEANGLPNVVGPADVPSKELFRTKDTSRVGDAASMESVRTGASGYQEEGFEIAI